METQHEYPPGGTIIRQGDEGSGFFALESGSVEVYKDDILLSVLLYPGTIFGEMSDILGKPRTCTVKARTACVVTHFDKADMMEIIREKPEIALKIFKTMATRLERTTQKLADVSKESTVWSVEKQSRPPMRSGATRAPIGVPRGTRPPVPAGKQ